MTTMFKVQDGVPLPDIDRTPKQPRRKWPVEGMKPGQMFFVQGKASKTVSAYVSRITKDLPHRYTARHCWMIPTGMFGGQVSWTLAEKGDDGAEEGTGVWCLEKDDGATH